MGRQRSVAVGSRRDTILRFPNSVRLQLQWLLPASHDGFVAADSPGPVDRATQSCRQRLVEILLGYFVCAGERTAGDLLRSSVGECGARRALGPGGLFLFAVMDQLHARPG